MLLGMLLLGVALGASGAVLLTPRRPGPPPPEGAGGGFVAHMERTIQPEDSAQRAAIIPILEAIDQRNRRVVDGSRAAMRDNLDSMLVALAPLLRPPQRERLTLLVRQLDGPPGGPGRGPPPGPGR
jgi:hypothetical protein